VYSCRQRTAEQTGTCGAKGKDNPFGSCDQYCRLEEVLLTHDGFSLLVNLGMAMLFRENSRKYGYALFSRAQVVKST
jgi:hypothetical protein